MKFIAKVVAVLTTVFGLIGFILVNSPDEVIANVQKWVSSPWTAWAVAWFLFIVTHPVFLALSFLAIGVLIGMWLERRKKVDFSLPWQMVLGTEMALLADMLEQARPGFSSSNINAELNVVRAKTLKRGFRFPPAQGNAYDAQTLAPYLRQMSAYLGRDMEGEARSFANTYKAS